MSSNNKTYTYDDQGRLVHVVFPNGTSVKHSYDQAGKKTTSVEMPQLTPMTYSPPTVTAFPKRISADLNNNPMVVMLSTGELIGWGDNTTGVLCNGIQAATNSPPQRLVFNPDTTVPPSTATIVDWAFTNANLYVVFSNGWVYSGGSNTYGQLGQNDTTNRPYLTRIEYFVTNSLTVTKVWAAGGYSTTNGGGAVYFSVTGGTQPLYGCGLNLAGNLGINTITNTLVPTACLNTNSATGTIVNVAVATEGTSASCFVLFSSGALLVAGYNVQGQLGIGTTTNRQPNL